MKQAVDCDTFLYPDDSCLVYQDKDMKEIERKLTFQMFVIGFWIINWTFNLEKTRQNCTIWHIKHRPNKISILNSEIHIKQYHTVTYLGWSSFWRVDDFESHKQK